MCVERRGWRRVYDLAERAIPADLLREEPSDAACLTRLVAQGGRALGVATRADLADYHRLLLDQVDAVIEARASCRSTVERLGRRRVGRPGRARDAASARRHRTTLLSPFDSLIWDRKRTTRIFGFEHASRPTSPSRSGPRLLRDAAARGGRIVGRVDPKREGRRCTPSRSRSSRARSRRWRPRCARPPSGSGATRSRSAGSTPAAAGGAASRRARRVGHAAWPTRRPAPRPYTGDGVPREPARRPRRLDRRRARRGRHDAPGVPQRRALGGAAVRRDARPRAARRAHADGPPRDPHPPLLHAVVLGQDLLGVARGDRALVADVATATWAARRTTRRRSWRRSAPTRSWYEPFADSAPALVPRVRRAKALFLNHVLDQPADRPRQARSTRSRTSTSTSSRERDDGIVVQRRQDARDRLGDHPRDVRRPEQRRPARGGQGRGLRAGASSPRWTRRA